MKKRLLSTLHSSQSQKRLTDKMIECLNTLTRFTFFNIFIYSRLRNKFCNLYQSLSTLRVRVLPLSDIILLFFEIVKGAFYVKEIWLSLNTGQTFIGPFRHRFLKTILANGVKGEPKVQSLKFSSQNENRIRDLLQS